MYFLDLVRALSAVVALTVATGTAFAQGTYPDKTVRIIMPFSAGTGGDTVTRQLAEKLTAKWGHPVVIDNRPGAAGINAIQALKQAPADGHTLMIGESGMIAITPQVLKNWPYDSAAEFAGITTTFKTYYMLVGGGQSQYDTYPKLIAAAKAKPGDISFASNAVGSPAHIAGAMMADLTGTKMTHVPYKDSSQMFQDVAGGSVSAVWATAGSLRPFLDSKRVRVLAVGSPQRLRGFEDIPTMAELGAPADFLVDNWNALFARKGTPATILAKINTDVGEAMRSPEMQTRLLALGYELYTGKPSDLDELIGKESRRYKAMINRVNIEPQ